MLEIIQSWSHDGQGAFFVFCIIATIIFIGGLGTFILKLCDKDIK